MWPSGGYDIADWDQVVARMAMSGELDLAMIPARAWDTEGVTSLRALHAPFLVTSDELLARIVTDSVADEMLGGLGGAGVTGLALLPEGMRHVFSFEDPLLSVADFNGATIRAPTSITTHATLEALGATADDFGGPGDLFESGVAAGTITAAESSFSRAGSLPDFTATAGNVTPFPKVNSLVINTETFDDLTDEQREILRNAALATHDWAISATVPDGDLARQFCEVGGRVVVASDAEVASLVQEVDDVYTELEADPDTKRFIERIRDLSAEVGAAPALEPCGPRADAPNVPSETPPTIVGGTEVRLVVNTQGGADSSPVLSADGPFAGCTSVTDLDATITELNPDVDVFSGEKRITCPGGEVTIQYDVMMNVNDPGVTSGTWNIVSSSLAGASSGGGQLRRRPQRVRRTTRKRLLRSRHVHGQRRRMTTPTRFKRHPLSQTTPDSQPSHTEHSVVMLTSTSGRSPNQSPARDEPAIEDVCRAVIPVISGYPLRRGFGAWSSAPRRNACSSPAG